MKHKLQKCEMEITVSLDYNQRPTNIIKPQYLYPQFLYFCMSWGLTTHTSWDVFLYRCSCDGIINAFVAWLFFKDLFNSCIFFLSQALEEQIKSLTSQIKEQEGKVKAAAPDEKQLKELETKVNQYRKGQNSSFTCTQKFYDAF